MTVTAATLTKMESDCLKSEEGIRALLQAKAGTLINLGFDKDGIFAALKNYVTEKSIPVSDDSLRELAKWAIDDSEVNEKFLFLISKEREHLT